MVLIDCLFRIEESDPHDTWKGTFPGLVELDDRHSAFCLSVLGSNRNPRLGSRTGVQ